MEEKKLTTSILYQKLEDIGFSKEFVRAIGLPSWWVDELDNSTNLSVIYEAAGHISQRLFIDLRSLLDINQKAKFKEDINYAIVIETLQWIKNDLIEHPLTDEEIQEQDLSDDTVDYYEQLLLLDI